MGYASPDDLEAFTGVAQGPDDQRLLDRASDHIDGALVGAQYLVDSTTGLATDTATFNAIINATCAQAEYWRATGDELGVMAEYRQISIGSVNVSRSESGRGAPVLCGRATQYLRVVGLLPIQPIAW